MKKFFIYFFIILGIILLIVLGVFAFMYMSPGKSVLGFQYVSYKNENEKIFTTTSDPSVQNIQSVDVYTLNSDIYIYPNGQLNEIKVVEVQDFSGFVKDANASCEVCEKTENKQYEESLLTLNAFVVKTIEPTGWIAKNKSRIEIYIGSSLGINTIFAKSLGGNVYYRSTVEENDLFCENLYLKTSNAGELNIDVKTSDTQKITNYYLSTDSGKVSFAKTQINASTISFTSNSGSLNISNENKNATLNGSLIVKSEENKSGPKIVIDKLNGNLTADTKKFSCSIKEIGSLGNYKTIAISSDESDINFETVYGRVSILAKENLIKNVVNIKKLEYPSQTNVFETGSGSCAINNLNGKVAVETTSGKVSFSNVTTSSDIRAYTQSGDINIQYQYSDENNKNNTLKVLTHSGNINLDNVSCHLDVVAVSSSYNSVCNVGFSAVATDDENIINVANGKVNLSFINSSVFTICRLVSIRNVVVNGTAIGSAIRAQDNDYILDQYEDYNYNYRINYNKDDETYQTVKYNQRGRIIIDSSKDVNIYVKNV